MGGLAYMLRRIIQKSQITSTKLQINSKFQISNKIKRQLFGILNFGHCDLPFDLAQGGGVVSPSTLLRTVSLSNGLSNHLVFVICYLNFFNC
jgi:hypothetical protein